MISDPLFYLCGIPAVMLFGMAKGGLGGGLAMVAVPLMALVIPPLQAAAILLPLLIVMDAFAVWTFRGKWDSRQLKIMIPGALVGVCIGALTYRYISSDGIKIMIAILSLAFGLEYYVKRYRTRYNQSSPIAAAPSSVTKGSLWSALSGYTSFAIHAGGPPASVYILPLRLDKTALMATLALFFAVTNWAKLIPYLMFNQISFESLLASLVLVPFAPIGVKLGYYLLHRVSDYFIYEISYVFLVIVGIKLGFEGLSNLI